MNDPQPVRPIRGRRITIDLTRGAADELDRLALLTGLDSASIFRLSLSLFRVCANAKLAGHRVVLVQEPNNPNSELTDVQLR